MQIRCWRKHESRECRGGGEQHNVILLAAGSCERAHQGPQRGPAPQCSGPAQRCRRSHRSTTAPPHSLLMPLCPPCTAHSPEVVAPGEIYAPGVANAQGASHASCSPSRHDCRMSGLIPNPAKCNTCSLRQQVRSACGNTGSAGAPFVGVLHPQPGILDAQHRSNLAPV